MQVFVCEKKDKMLNKDREPRDGFLTHFTTYFSHDNEGREEEGRQGAREEGQRWYGRRDFP